VNRRVSRDPVDSRVERRVVDESRRPKRRGDLLAVGDRAPSEGLVRDPVDEVLAPSSENGRKGVDKVLGRPGLIGNLGVDLGLDVDLWKVMTGCQYESSTFGSEGIVQRTENGLVGRALDKVE
jgi:hypothetical protein